MNHRSPGWRPLCWLAGSWLLLTTSSQVAAQNDPPATPREHSSDQVWLAPPRRATAPSSWYPGEVTTVRGQIVHLDDQQLRMMGMDDQSTELSFAAERLLWIKPAAMSENESAALTWFASGEYEKSLRPLIEAVEQRPPVWRQQWLSMLAASAAWRTQRYAVALELISQLDQRPLPPMVLAQLPIAWQRTETTNASTEAALARLSDPSPAVRLVAASWLVQSPHRAPAMAAMEPLSQEPQRPQIAQLARALRWRIATPPEVREQASQWETQIDALPMVLQVGPSLTLIEKLRAAGEAEKAKRWEWSLSLTPPFPHPDLPHRSR